MTNSTRNYLNARTRYELRKCNHFGLAVLTGLGLGMALVVVAIGIMFR